jgi:hypothetical protein
MEWIISIALTMQIILRELIPSLLIISLVCLPHRSLLKSNGEVRRRKNKKSKRMTKKKDKNLHPT